MALLLNYPARADNPQKRYAYAMRMQEHLRMLHNLIGRWLRDGLTQDEYDNGVAGTVLAGKEARRFKLPDSLKARQAFKAQINKSEYDVLIQLDWDRRHRKVNLDMAEIRRVIHEDSNFDVEIELGMDNE